MALDSITTPLKNNTATVAAATSKTFPYLDHLAAELQIEIAKNLDKEDLRSLRRVSHSLAKNTFEVFAKKNFSNLCCCFNRQSLENVRSISATSDFVRHVKSISFYAGPGYKTALSWPEFVSESVEVRGRTANDMRLKNIFANFAKHGSAKYIGLSTTEDFFVPAIHAMAVALATSGHFVEELRCSIDKPSPYALNTPAGAWHYSWDFAKFTAFPRVAKQSWMNLRAIHVVYQSAGKFTYQAASALCAVIHGANKVQDLVLDTPFRRFHEHIGRALTPLHSVKSLTLGNPEEVLHFDSSQVRALLSS